MEKDFTSKIGGEAGYGIISSGLIFSKVALRSSYFVFDTTEYPSLIRGGHNVYRVKVAKNKIHSPNISDRFFSRFEKKLLTFIKRIEKFDGCHFEY